MDSGMKKVVVEACGVLNICIGGSNFWHLVILTEVDKFLINVYSGVEIFDFKFNVKLTIKFGWFSHIDFCELEIVWEEHINKMTQ